MKNKTALESAEQILNKMIDIEYGFVSQAGEKIRETDEDFGKKYWNEYFLRSPKEIIISKTGSCWDQVELERYYFNQEKINTKTFFFVYYDHKNRNYPCHTLLTFECDNMFYWFEHSWFEMRGIHKYFSQKELLKDAREKFIKSRPEIPSGYDPNKMCVYEYKKPNMGIGSLEFYQHCEAGNKITDL